MEPTSAARRSQRYHSIFRPRLCLLLVLLCSTSARAEGLLLSHAVSGGRFQYTTRKRDSFASLGSRYGENAELLARSNGFRVSSHLAVGTVLWVDNRHVVPADLDDGIIVNVPQRMLFLLSGGKAIGAYPVAVGRPGWRTPRGDFTVIEKRKNPVWRVPPSIQAEMAREGKRVRTRVPPGPDNPLGKYWIGLSLDSIGIHATNAPWSIYQCRTHGCIRLHPDDAAALFSAVELGTPGKIVYEPVLMAHLANGDTFLEANRDIYRLESEDPLADLKGLAESGDFGNMVDWLRVSEVLRDREGLARQVTVGRECRWEILPWKMWGLSQMPSKEGPSVAEACSNLEP